MKRPTRRRPAPPTASAAARTSAGIAAATVAAPDTYTLLFDVQIRHAFYNASDQQCPDLQAVPTAECAALMRALGLLCRPGEYGFAVYLRASRTAALASYLTAHAGTTAPGLGFWTNLSFQLLPRNAGFVGITDLPITTNPQNENLFISNLSTTEVNGQLVFTGQDGKPGQQLLPVATSRIAVPATPAYTPVLTGLSGAAVPAASTTDQTGTVFHVAGLPSGYYTIGFVASDGSMSTTPPPGYHGPSGSIIIPIRPLSLGLVTLLLARPAPGTGDASAFPVTIEGHSTTIAPVSLMLSFEARNTYWLYYVVAQERDAGLSPNLAIAGSATSFTKSMVPLPNGQQAVLFTARTPLPLRQQSNFRFKLTGQRRSEAGGQDQISIDRLPTAPAAPVWPSSPAAGNAGTSEIFIYV